MKTKENNPEDRQRHSTASQQDRESIAQASQQPRREESRGGLARRDLFGGFGGLWDRDPFFRRLNEQMDRWLGDLWPGRDWLSFRTGREGLGLWAPQIETFQRGDEFVVRADLPGLNKDEVSVELTDEALTIQGERRQEHEEEREGYYRSERSYGSFYRVVPLPEGAIPESAKAQFRNGVLEVVIKAPPREVSRGRRLEISEGTEAQRASETPGQQPQK